MGKINEVEYRVKTVADTKGVKDTESAVQKLNGTFNEARGKVEGLGKAFLNLGLIATAGVGLKKTFDFMKDASQASQAIETYEVSLKNMLGTTDAARERMQEYFAIAKETPFDLPQVIEAGNKLQALGRYSEENVKMLGDLAAASGKPMEQAMSAFSKLASGQKGIAVDMFRDLMITTDDWTKATGKGVDKQGQLLATTEEMIAALPGLLKSKGYLGMMATQAETTAGKLSNLEDGIFQLKVAIGDRLSSSTKSFATQMGYAVDKVKRFVEIPVEQKIAAEKAELNALVGTLTDSNTLEAQREDALRKLNARYPDFMKNLGDEVTNTEKLKDALAEANKEYDKKMKLATYERISANIQDDMDETIADLAEWQASKFAKEELNKLKPQWNQKITELQGRAGGATKLIPTAYWDVSNEGNLYASAGGLFLDGIPNLSEKDKNELLALKAEINAQEDAQKLWGLRDEDAKIKEYQNKYNALIKRQESIKGLIDEMTPNLDDSGTSDGNSGTGDGGNGGNGGTSASAVESAAASISSGGKQIKTFNITIGSILGENTNIFQSSSDSPETAQGFLEKLSNALQMVVNDVNYAAQ
ncbi:MAG: hypothetical protein IKO34_10405 [Bacteroidales bacterium]|nr:hypothetical protein [Bacteroidales bacterium]